MYSVHGQFCTAVEDVQDLCQHGRGGGHFHQGQGTADNVWNLYQYEGRQFCGVAEDAQDLCQCNAGGGLSTGSC